MLADDLGHSDVGFNGNAAVAAQDPQLKANTPTVDALARSGGPVEVPFPVPTQVSLAAVKEAAVGLPELYADSLEGLEEHAPRRAVDELQCFPQILGGGREVVALDVLYQRQRQHRFIRNILDDSRNR